MLLKGCPSILRRRWIAWVLLGIPCSAQYEPPRSSVEFYLWHPKGEKVGPYRVQSFHSTRSSASYEKSFGTGLSAKNIPQGEYSYVLVRADVKNPRGTNLNGKVWVRQRKAFFALEVPTNPIVTSDGHEASVDRFTSLGTLRVIYSGLPASSARRWVRLCRVPNGTAEEAEVDGRTNSFEIDRLVPGRYHVLLMEGAIPVQADIIDMTSVFIEGPLGHRKIPYRAPSTQGGR